MSEAKHTPGPWRANDHISPQMTVTGPDGEIVAPLRYCDGAGRCRADYGLIAAAPDLLAALEYILGWNPVEWSAEKARDVARAAVAKARGEDVA